MGPGRREICVGICTGPNIRVHIPRNTPVGAFPTGDDYTRLQTVESLTFFLKRDVFLTYKKKDIPPHNRQPLQKMFR